MKRKLKQSLFMVCCLSVVMTAGCGTEMQDMASVIRLERTKGIVNVFSDAKEKGIEVLEKMKLYAGYFIETEENSTAHISLDDTKAVKLDETSTMEIVEQGDDLLLELKDGNLFFNVSEPLSEEETFRIKTSNAIMGIRGTSGYIVNKDKDRSAVYLLSGKAEITATSPVTGEEKKVEIESGERIMIYRNDLAKNEEQLRFVTKSFNKSNIPSFVKDEFRDNEEFRKEIQSVLNFKDDDWDDDDDGDWDDDWDDDDDDDWDDDWDDDDDENDD